MKAVFIDESKSKNYTICAVKMDAVELANSRKVISSLRLKGQSRIHFVSESDSRRKKILTEFRKLKLEVIFYISTAGSDAQDRKNCLEALVRELDPNSFHQLWLELDSNHLSQDRANLSRALRESGLSESVQFFHESSRVQTLLWLPDALAWCNTRGGIWKKELQTFDCETVSADEL